MKFVMKPSFEHMTLVKIATSLWNQDDVRALISKLCCGNLYSSEKWKIIEKSVIVKVQKLSLPQHLKEKVLSVIQGIGLQIKGWMVFHFKCFCLCVNIPAEIYWTPEGTIDRKKTAEVLVKDENLDISTRYKLACIYCLEKDIIHFWDTIPEDLKESDSNEFPISFWARYMKRRQLDSSHISYRSEFDLCVRGGNKVAAEYFLPKLTQWEKKEFLVTFAKNVKDADTLCFLMSEMDKAQNLEVFRNDPCGVLCCFLQWPFQCFFIEMANCLWEFLSKNDYYNILKAIICKVSDGYKDCNYQKLFREFWQESPNALKRLITDKIDERELLMSLFRIKDKENITLILKDTTITAKNKLIYSENGNTLCESFLHNNEWDFLEYFIRECIQSRNEMLEFKEKFEKHMMHSYLKVYFERYKQEWDQIFMFSDDSLLKCEKRNAEEGECSSSKRFHSLQ